MRVSFIARAAVTGGTRDAAPVSAGARDVVVPASGGKRLRVIRRSIRERLRRRLERG